MCVRPPWFETAAAAHACVQHPALHHLCKLEVGARHQFSPTPSPVSPYISCTAVLFCLPCPLSRALDRCASLDHRACTRPAQAATPGWWPATVAAMLQCLWLLCRASMLAAALPLVTTCAAVLVFAREECMPPPPSSVPVYCISPWPTQKQHWVCI